MDVTEPLPPLGLGTWQSFDIDPIRYAERAQVLQEFVTLGGRLIDSSPMYGRAEAAVGELSETADPDRRLFLATKVWTTGREAGIAQMNQSFRRLRTARIDLMQVHNLVDVHTHLATLREWQESGRVRYIGVTHYAAAAHGAVAAVLETEPVEFVQINYSVAEPEAEQRLLPLARDRGIRVIVNRPFAEGALLRRLHRRPLPGWAGDIGCTTWAQLLLKFVLSHPAVTCAIPATASVEHLRDNMAALQQPWPDGQQRRQIAAAALA